jgi:hypothetical protein
MSSPNVEKVLMQTQAALESAEARTVTTVAQCIDNDGIGTLNSATTVRLPHNFTLTSPSPPFFLFVFFVAAFNSGAAKKLRLFFAILAVC